MKFKKLLSLISAAAISVSCFAGMAISASAATSTSEVDWATITGPVEIDVLGADYLNGAESTKLQYSGAEGAMYLATNINSYSVSHAGVRLKNANAQYVAIKVSGSGLKIEATVKNGGSTARTVYAAKTLDTMDSSGDTYTNYYAKLSNPAGSTGTLSYTKTTAGEETIYFRSAGDQYIQKINVSTVSSIPDAESVTVTPDSATVRVGRTISLSASVSPADASQEVTWTSSDEKLATVSGGVVTGVAEGDVTITATTSNGKTATSSVTVEPALEIPYSEGTVNDLQAATETTIYDFRQTALAAEPISETALFIGNRLYFDKKVYIVGETGYNGLLYYTGKSSKNLDGTTNSDGIRLKAGQDVFAVKLAVGATVEVPVYSGGGSDRYGIIAENYDANATTGALAATENIGLTSGSSPQTLTYTNNTGAEKVVYITATGDSFFSQVKVTVPLKGIVEEFGTFTDKDYVGNAKAFTVTFAPETGTLTAVKVASKADPSQYVEKTGLNLMPNGGTIILGLITTNTNATADSYIATATIE